MAQNQSEKYIQGAILQSGGIPNVNMNTPPQYANRQKQYLAKRTRLFSAEKAKYASDYVEVKVQGVAENDFYKYLTTNIRFSDWHSLITETKQTDDYKVILFDEPKIDYFPIGAKLQTMGSTWICINPSNLSSVNTTALIRRCNTSYNLYDYYGNILTEPIIIDKVTMMGNDNEKPTNSIVLMDGYFNVICQLNENTRKLGLNQRILLGSKAYHITGFNDFAQEFSGDYDSTHILYFTVRVEEPDDSDDIPNHIAGGNNLSFSAELLGNTELSVGQTAQLTPHFIKNSEIVGSTDNNPLTWTYESSNAEVATVDENGVVTAMADGNAQVTATLTQNKAITATLELVANSTAAEPYVAFTSVIPQSIEQYDNVTITASYYENGVETDKPITWSFGGANKRSYVATINGNSVEIYCALADNNPLTVTAECEGKTISTNIALLGY